MYGGWQTDGGHDTSSRLIASRKGALPRGSTYLAEIDGQIDFVVLHAAGQRRTLPPAGRAVDGVLWRMVAIGHRRFAVVADLGKAMQGNGMLCELCLKTPRLK